jgi:hypothetical protein
MSSRSGLGVWLGVSVILNSPSWGMLVCFANWPPVVLGCAAANAHLLGAMSAVPLHVGTWSLFIVLHFYVYTDVWAK